VTGELKRQKYMKSSAPTATLLAITDFHASSLARIALLPTSNTLLLWTIRRYQHAERQTELV